MFENPRRGRQARNFTKSVPKISLDLKSSSGQIFSQNWRGVLLSFSWYVSLLYLHDCEMKFPNSNFYIELKPTPDDFFLSFETCTARYYLLNFSHDWSSLTTNSESANSFYTNCPLAVKSISESRPFYFRFHAHNNRTTVSLKNYTTFEGIFKELSAFANCWLQRLPPGAYLMNDKDTQNLHLKIFANIRTINISNLKLFTMNWFIL